MKTKVAILVAIAGAFYAGMHVGVQLTIKRYDAFIGSGLIKGVPKENVFIVGTGEKDGETSGE